MMRLLAIHLPLVFLLLSLTACQPAEDDNRVVQYFTGAERQVETDGQKEEIRHVLRDLLSLPAAQVKDRRYADYEGKAGAWTAPQLLEKYYVPAKPMGLDNARFYQDIETPRARTLFKRLLEDLH